jgi:hypothetical protein
VPAPAPPDVGEGRCARDERALEPLRLAFLYGDRALRTAAAQSIQRIRDRARGTSEP